MICQFLRSPTRKVPAHKVSATTFPRRKHRNEVGFDRWMFRQLPYALIPKLHSITMANQTLASQVKHILVVDDSHVPAQMVANVLRKAGHKVTIANDGQRAWLKAQQQQFDLVLTDEQMPCMNSSELCRRLRGLEGYKEIGRAHV